MPKHRAVILICRSVMPIRRAVILIRRSVMPIRRAVILIRLSVMLMHRPAIKLHRLTKRRSHLRNLVYKNTHISREHSEIFGKINHLSMFLKSNRTGGAPPATKSKKHS